MSATRIPSRVRRLNKVQKISVAGVSALGVAALTFSLVPSNTEPEIAPQAAAAAAPVAFTNAAGSAQAKTVQNSMLELVSYTHLDVYKRQVPPRPRPCRTACSSSTPPPSSW